jgi:3-oxoacyl-[acyl-carrier protein] reductase
VRHQPITNLKNKVAVVTGSARGIGKAIAERFGSLGASVVVNYATSEGAAQETVAAITRLGGTAIAVQADVSKVVDIDRLFATTIERYGCVDIVVANAGVEIVGTPIADVSENDFDRLFAVNTKGTFFTLQQAARHIADHGRVMYVGSSSTAFPLPGYALYSGSKMAPRIFVEVLAKELGPRGVTVNSILPTVTAGAGLSTDAVRPQASEFIRAFNPMQRVGTLEDVADAAEYLAGDLSAFVSGQHLLLSGGGPA